MHAGILSKCIDELKTDAPDISYIRGMLETLLAVSGSVTAPLPITFQPHDNSRTVPESEPMVPEETAAGGAYFGNVGAVAGLQPG
jgi:hypothetical protein